MEKALALGMKSLYDLLPRTLRFFSNSFNTHSRTHHIYLYRDEKEPEEKLYLMCV